MQHTTFSELSFETRPKGVDDMDVSDLTPFSLEPFPHPRGKDVMVRPNGTGKTLAFCNPILESFSSQTRRAGAWLSSRELA